MSNTIIKYGISFDYVQNWGYKEAVREIMQNFIDYGDYKIDDKIAESVTVINNYQPEGYEFLKVGFSQKHNENSVGKYGEGLKMALLVMNRLDICVAIRIGTNDGQLTSFYPVSYNDPYLGDCFGIKVVKETVFSPTAYFKVTFDKTDEYAEMAQYFIKHDSDIIFESDKGSIVDMPAGNIYVGGILVTNYPDIPRSYNLHPKDIDLGRDRDFPSTMDIEYSCSKIFQAYCIEKDELLKHSSKEVQYMTELPISFVNTVDPLMMKGNLEYISSESGIVSASIGKVLAKNHIIQEKTTKLKIELTKRSSPADIIEGFHKKHGWCLNGYTDALVDFRVIIEKSKNWN